TGELGGAGLGSVVVNDPSIAPGAVAILRGMGITVVPEPTALSLLAVAVAAPLATRRRRAGEMKTRGVVPGVGGADLFRKSQIFSRKRFAALAHRTDR